MLTKTEIKQHRLSASLQSKGESSDMIKATILQYMANLPLKTLKSIVDIGCGTGSLLHNIQQHYPHLVCSGFDLTNFLPPELEQNITFHQKDLNEHFGEHNIKYDLVISSEVIEHLENPRHFIREVSKLLNPQGHILLSTPNIENITSLLSFIFRGYHGAFGPKNYPAHITPLGVWDMRNIIQEIRDLELLQIIYIPNDRIPGTSIHWRQIFPKIQGKRFSQNYLIHIRKQ